MPAITDLLFTSETTKDIASTRQPTNVKTKQKNQVQHIPRGAFLVTGTRLNRTCSKSAGPGQDDLIDLSFWRTEVMFCGCTVWPQVKAEALAVSDAGKESNLTNRKVR